MEGRASLIPYSDIAIHFFLSHKGPAKMFRTRTQIVVVVVVFVVMGTFANPVAPVVAADDQVGDSHDLETAEHLLEIIEKKIAKLYKKCLKHGGCQPSYGYSTYGHSADYGYGSSYGHGYSGYGSHSSGSPVYY